MVRRFGTHMTMVAAYIGVWGGLVAADSRDTAKQVQRESGDRVVVDNQIVVNRSTCAQAPDEGHDGAQKASLELLSLSMDAEGIGGEEVVIPRRTLCGGRSRARPSRRMRRRGSAAGVCPSAAPR